MGCRGCDAIVVDGDDAAVAENREVFAEAKFCDFDLVEEIRPRSSVQGTGQRGQNRVVVLCVSAELGDGLSDQDIEPVERLRLVRINIVVCFREDSAYRQRRRVSQSGGALAAQVLGVRV